MEHQARVTQWIAAYLDWAGIDDNAIGAEDGRDREVDFCRGYLDWLDTPVFSAPARRPDGSRGSGRRASDLLGGSEGFREAALLAALHAQSDCLHILRRVLDQGPVGTSTIRLAAEALEHAQRLLDDERHAWHALDELRAGEPRQASQAPVRPGNGEWPSTLEHVASEVRSLTSTVLALQVH